MEMALVKLEVVNSEDPSHLSLALNRSFPELQRLIPEITRISINGLNSTEYNYTVKSPALTDSLNFDVLIDYYVPILKNPVIRASLDLPLALENNPQFSMISDEISVTAPTFFAVDSSTKEDVNRAKGSSKAGGYLLSTTTVIVSFLDPASFIGIYGLLNVGMINNFR